jgi:hypothetical protein
MWRQRSFSGCKYWDFKSLIMNKNYKKGTGIAIGISIGIAIGVALGNIAIGISLGLIFGIIYDRKKSINQNINNE